MRRTKTATTKKSEGSELPTLIKEFAINKSQFDALKKICEAQNAKIKELMGDMMEFVAGEYKAVRSIRVSEGFDAPALLAVIHGDKKLAKKVIKTQEYVDMDALESAIFNAEVSESTLSKINACRTRKETVALSIKKVGGK